MKKCHFVIEYTLLNGKSGKIKTSYDDFVCAGEFVRNVAVNCGIDPDTVDGFTKNVKIIFLSQRENMGSEWSYNPDNSLRFYFQQGSFVELVMEEV